MCNKGTNFVSKKSHKSKQICKKGVLGAKFALQIVYYPQSLAILYWSFFSFRCSQNFQLFGVIHFCFVANTGKLFKFINKKWSRLLISFEGILTYDSQVMIHNLWIITFLLVREINVNFHSVVCVPYEKIYPIFRWNVL